MNITVSPDVTSLESVVPRPVRWLWDGRIAIGKLSIIAGDPGLGKSLLTIELASIVSRGGVWPADASVAMRGGALIMSAEDDVEDTICPRLIAAGADRMHIKSMTMVVERDGGGKSASRRLFSLAENIPQLEAAISQVPTCRLVVIDPISAFTSSTDTHKNSDVRGLLAPLADLAQRKSVAIVGVTHLNKSSGPAMYRTMGSLAWVAAARSVIAIVKDSNDPSRRLLVPVKNNLGNDLTGLAYRVIPAVNGSPRLEWEPEQIVISADDALQAEEGATERCEAIEWLEDALAVGAVETTELQKLAKMAGHAWRTVRRAKEELGIKPRKQGFAGKWVWELPKMATKPQDGHARDVAAFGLVGHLGDQQGVKKSV